MTSKKKIEHTVAVGSPPDQLVVRPGMLNSFILQTPNVAVDIIEAEDALFRYDSAVFLPTAIPEDELYAEPEAADDDGTLEAQWKTSGLSVLEAIFRFHKMCLDNGRDKRLLITGHTDSMGSDASNEKLSLARAKVILSMIIGSIPYESAAEPSASFGGPAVRDEFVSMVMDKNKETDQQHILKWVGTTLGWSGVDPGEVDGNLGSRTQLAIKAFKTHFKNEFPDPARYYEKGVAFPDDLDTIKESFKSGSMIGKASWAAIFEIYQAELQLLLKETGGEMDLMALRRDLRWADEKMAVGCGETWPLDEKGTDNYRSRTNRRVEILFYDPTPFKQLGGLPCKDGAKCAESDCHIFRSVDKYDHKKEPDKPNLKWEYINLKKLKYAELEIHILNGKEDWYCEIKGPNNLIGVTDAEGVVTFPQVLIGKYEIMVGKYHPNAKPSDLNERTRPVEENETLASIAFDELIHPSRLEASNQELLKDRDPNVLFAGYKGVEANPDEVAIPEFEQRRFVLEVNTGKNVRTLVMDGAFTVFKYRLLKSGKPMKNTRYELSLSIKKDGSDTKEMPRRAYVQAPVVETPPTQMNPLYLPENYKTISVKVPVNGPPKASVTDGEGYLDHDIPANATKGTLTILSVKGEKEETFELTFGAVLPLELKDKKGKRLFSIVGAKQRFAQLGYFNGEINSECTDEYKFSMTSFKEDCLYTPPDDPNKDDIFSVDPDDKYDEKAAYWLRRKYGDDQSYGKP